MARRTAARALAPQPTAGSRRAFRDAARARFAHERAVVVATLHGLGATALTSPHAQHTVAALVTALESGPLADQWSTDFEPLITDAVTAGGQSIADQLGGDFPSTGRDAADAAFSRAQDLADLVSATTANQFLDQYRAVRDDGGTAADLIAAADASVFATDTTNSRSDLIGDVEAGIGLAIGADLAGSLFADEKVWSHDGSPKEPRAEHEDMSGETVGVDETFSNGLAYPRDPSGDISETANCTCSVYYLASGDSADSGDGESDVDAESDAEAD